MRALTVQQPWAWAIVHGGKTIENRTLPWRYRGPLVIHAGLEVDKAGLEDLRIGHALRDAGHVMPDTIRNPILRQDFGHLWGAQIYTGAVLGVVDLVDVHPAALGATETCCQPWGDWTANTVHLVLENPRPLPAPVKAKGRLGLWHDVDLFAEVLHQLREAS